MPNDICKCNGEGCPIKTNCYRFMVPSDMFQAYYKEPPYKDGKCDRYWPLDKTKTNSVTTDSKSVGEK